MSEQRATYVVTTHTPLECDSNVMVLTNKEKAVIEQWRKSPSAQAVILPRDAARLIGKIITGRAMARSNQIEPFLVVNLLNYYTGNILAFEPNA